MIRLLPLLLAGSLSASVSDDLRKYEGFRTTAYLDTQGFWTCGWGHRCAEGTKMTLLAAEKALADDISSAEHAAKRVFPTFADHPQEVKDVLVMMIFQLGSTGCAKFVKFGRAIAAHDYATASREMLSSRWHQQTPKRCEELARKINHD
jgi:GH24 family phage-related lysozyme (muramidase)